MIIHNTQMFGSTFTKVEKKYLVIKKSSVVKKKLKR
jgi:hypothetical protein